MRILVIYLIVFMGVIRANAQSITKQYGDYCQGQETVFVLSGAGSCTSYSWTIANATNGSDYSVIGGSTNSGFRVSGSSLSQTWLSRVHTSATVPLVQSLHLKFPLPASSTRPSALLFPRHRPARETILQSPRRPHMGEVHRITNGTSIMC